MSTPNPSSELRTEDIAQRGDVFVVVTCRNCPHSQAFMSKLPVLKALANANGLLYVHIDNETTATCEWATVAEYPSVSGFKLPCTLQACVKWFPLIMIISRPSWNAYSEKLKVNIYGVEPGDVGPRGPISYNYDDIEKWIKSRTNASFFTDQKKSNDLVIRALEEVRKNISKTQIEKLSGQIIKLKQQKKYLEDGIRELESMESMLKTINTQSNEQILHFLNGAEIGWNLSYDIHHANRIECIKLA